MASKPLAGREAVGGDEFCLGLVESEVTVCLCREMKILDEKQNYSLSLEALPNFKMVTVAMRVLGAFLNCALTFHPKIVFNPYNNPRSGYCL